MCDSYDCKDCDFKETCNNALNVKICRNKECRHILNEGSCLNPDCYYHTHDQSELPDKWPFNH